MGLNRIGKNVPQLRIGGSGDQKTDRLLYILVIGDQGRSNRYSA